MARQTGIGCRWYRSHREEKACYESTKVSDSSLSYARTDWPAKQKLWEFNWSSLRLTRVAHDTRDRPKEARQSPENWTDTEITIHRKQDKLTVWCERADYTLKTKNQLSKEYCRTQDHHETKLTKFKINSKLLDKQEPGKCGEIQWQQTDAHKIQSIGK